MDKNHLITRAPTPGRANRLVRWVLEALEGRYVWGYIEIGALGRGAWMRERLTLLPPGTDASERRALTVYRNWPVIGAIGALLLMLVFGDRLAPPIAFVAAFATYGFVTWMIARATRRRRRESIRLVAVTVAVGGGVERLGNVDTLRCTKATLADLDRRSAMREITPAQYENEWATLYWALDAQRQHLDEERQRGIPASESTIPPERSQGY